MFETNCKHLNVGKEVYCGTKTGDYICYNCGETFSENPRKVN